ncbi:Nuclease precursor [Bacteroidales bacterium Barb6]|nr:Nuclease precursor [Bacteroidales bacterium Barb6]
MAKKKATLKTKRNKKKKSAAPSLLVLVKRIIIAALIAVAAFAALVLLYEHWKKEPFAQQEVPRATAAVALAFPKDAEYPRLQKERKEQIIRHEGYTVSYNPDDKIANWVAWELTAEEAQSSIAKRTNSFVPDPDVKGASAHTKDYAHTGYDRGHLAPAADMHWSEKAMRESFYLSNICPQKPKLNRGVWKKLEEQSRQWAEKYGALLIASGPVTTDNLERLGEAGVAVPQAFYKVICGISDNKYRGIAFLLENRDYGRTSLPSLAIPIDSVEKVTGIDFFYLLPDEEEESMEASVYFF